MRRFTTLVFGVGLGFVLAHFVNQSPGGRQFFERLDRAGKELANAVIQGYRDAE